MRRTNLEILKDNHFYSNFSYYYDNAGNWKTGKITVCFSNFEKTFKTKKSAYDFSNAILEIQTCLYLIKEASRFHLENHIDRLRRQIKESVITAREQLQYISK